MGFAAAIPSPAASVPASISAPAGRRSRASRVTAAAKTSAIPSVYESAVTYAAWNTVSGSRPTTNTSHRARNGARIATAIAPSATNTRPLKSLASIIVVPTSASSTAPMRMPTAAGR